MLKRVDYPIIPQEESKLTKRLANLYDIRSILIGTQVKQSLVDTVNSLIDEYLTRLDHYYK
jgi:hypothetical protein